MAPLPTIAHVFRVAFDWTNTANALVASNVMHFSKSGGTLVDLGSKLDSHVTAAMWTMQTTAAQITQVVLTPLDGGGASLPFAPATPAHWTGTGGAGDFSPHTAAIIKLLTGKRGRSYRGRVFTPWVSEGQMSDGVLNSGSCATTTAAWIAFANAMSGDGWPMVVASYKLATAEPVIGLGCEKQVATQRRRNKRTSAV